MLTTESLIIAIAVCALVAVHTLVAATERPGRSPLSYREALHELATRHGYDGTCARRGCARRTRLRGPRAGAAVDRQPARHRHPRLKGRRPPGAVTSPGHGVADRDNARRDRRAHPVPRGTGNRGDFGGGTGRRSTGRGRCSCTRPVGARARRRRLRSGPARNRRDRRSGRHRQRPNGLDDAHAAAHHDAAEHDRAADQHDEHHQHHHDDADQHDHPDQHVEHDHHDAVDQHDNVDRHNQHDDGDEHDQPPPRTRPPPHRRRRSTSRRRSRRRPRRPHHRPAPSCWCARGCRRTAPPRRR